MNRLPSPVSSIAGPRARPLLHWLLVLLLGLQLLASTQHHHDLAKVDGDCVACDLAMQFSGSTAALPVVMSPVLLLACFLLLRSARPVFLRAPSCRLLPFSQAPPSRR